MKFKNTPNERVELSDGRVAFLSRSPAVCTALIHVDADQKISVAFGKRGRHLNLSGKWGLISGFLDWDESCEEAAVREAWEEMGVKIDIKELEFYELSSNPKKYGQNVSAHYYVVRTEKPELKPDKKEVVEARWFTREELAEMNEDDFAFDHYHRALNITHVH